MLQGREQLAALLLGAAILGPTSGTANFTDRFYVTITTLDDEVLSVALAKASLEVQRCSAAEAARKTAAEADAEIAAEVASAKAVVTLAANVVAQIGRPVEAARMAAAAVESSAARVRATRLLPSLRRSRLEVLCGPFLRHSVGLGVRGNGLHILVLILIF